MSQPSPPASTTPFVPPWQRESWHRRAWARVLEWRQGILLLLIGGTTLWLWQYVQQHSHFPAVALSRAYVVNAPEVGTLGSLLVDKGSVVKKGQIIGQMDNRTHQVEYRIAQLEKKRLERTLVSEALKFRLSQVALQTRLQAFVHEAQANWASGRGRVRSTRAELSALNKELRWLTTIRRKQLGRPNNLGALQARQKSLKALLGAMPSLMRAYRRKRAKARSLARRARVFSGKKAKAQIDKILRPLQSLWAIQALRIKKLDLLRKRLTLRAPVAGIVQEVLQRPGARLLQGAPLLRITRANKGAIMAYIDQVTARRIKPGMLVQVALRYPEKKSAFATLSKPKPLCARVTALGGIEPIPLRFRRDPKKPTWVRPVAIRLRKPHPLIPGEMLTVDFTPGTCRP